MSASAAPGSRVGSEQQRARASAAPTPRACGRPPCARDARLSSSSSIARSGGRRPSWAMPEVLQHQAEPARSSPSSRRPLDAPRSGAIAARRSRPRSSASCRGCSRARDALVVLAELAGQLRGSPRSSSGPRRSRPASPASTPAPLIARSAQLPAGRPERRAPRRSARGPRPACRAAPSSARAFATQRERGVGVAVGDGVARGRPGRCRARRRAGAASRAAVGASMPCSASAKSVGERAGVAVARRVQLARRVEPLERVLAHGLEHPEAAARRACTRLWSASAAMPSSASGPQTASAASSVKPPVNTPSWPNSALRRRGRAGRSSSRSRRAASAGAAARRAGRSSAGPAAGQPVEDLGGGQDLGAGGGELDRQRQPVEARADLLDRARRPARARAAGRRRGRGARTARPRARSRAAAARARARRRAAARARLVTTSFDRGELASTPAQLRRRVEQLLEVVDDQQQLRRGEVLARPPARARRHRAPDRRARASGTKRAPSANRGAEPVRELEREARLADPARAGEREQADVAGPPAARARSPGPRRGRAAASAGRAAAAARAGRPARAWPR